MLRSRSRKDERCALEKVKIRALRGPCLKGQVGRGISEVIWQQANWFKGSVKWNVEKRGKL